jgi:hypothetical protein
MRTVSDRFLDNKAKIQYHMSSFDFLQLARKERELGTLLHSQKLNNL